MKALDVTAAIFGAVLCIACAFTPAEVQSFLTEWAVWASMGAVVAIAVLAIFAGRVGADS